MSIMAKNCSKPNWDSEPYDQLACWRVDITGQFKVLLYNVTMKDIDVQMVAQFFAKHPAAPYWIKDSPHQFKMVYMFNLKKIFYTGGYGNLHYIGEIGPMKYSLAQPEKPDWASKNLSNLS